MLVSLNRFFPVHIPILIQVFHVGIVGQNIVVRFQLQLDPLTPIMQTEREVKMGQVVNMLLLRRGLNPGFVKGGNIADGVGSMRSG